MKKTATINLEQNNEKLYNINIQIGNESYDNQFNQQELKDFMNKQIPEPNEMRFFKTALAKFKCKKFKIIKN